MSTISNQSQPRRVARRACLSCREKKIKCDGEPMITVTGADGTNKIIPERTRTCSNCRFLDIECVFVQSNRGGKRKKRDPDSTDLDPDIKKSKSLHLNQYDHEQSQASPPAQQ
ncbi:MAG: Zn(II)2Cys6 transcription factor domain-containing protein, partial [Asgard group archaeon]|nr:Zn(II)2Cys6 transcription factor domain-containing protein [Asgard group archaeon]